MSSRLLYTSGITNPYTKVCRITNPTRRVKKNNIKAIAMLVFILMAFSINAQKQITFKHIGWTDKPMITIEIYPSQTDRDSLSDKEHLTHQYFVKESLFDSLYYYIKNNKIKPLSKSEVKNDFGEYSLSYIYETESYEIIVSWEDAILFFEGMLPMIKNISFIFDGHKYKDNCFLYYDIEDGILSRIKGCHRYQIEKD